MVCEVQLNSIKYLQNKGATNDVRRIIDEDLFNELNDKLTALAETKYGLKTNGAKLFSINMSEHIDPWRSTYYRDTKYKILRAEPNVPLFDRLQELFNARPDQPMMMRELPVETQEEIIDSQENPFTEINGVLFMDVKLDELQNQRSREIAEVLAKRLSLGTNTKFENITKEEAAEILKNRPVKYNGEPAFYYAGTVYVVGENVNVRTVLHEFSHPVLNALRKTNNILFQNLYNQAIATEEGQGVFYYVKTNYPELEESSDLFKEEVLAYAMQLKALNRINNEIETEGYKSFMNKLFAAIKQLLRRLFGNKVNVAKLDVDTTLEELADMLLDKDFEFATDLITEDDLAMFSREVLERAKELNKFSNKESMEKVVRTTYEYTKRILTEAENFKGDKVSRNLLKESLFQKGTNRYLREVVSN